MDAPAGFVPFPAQGPFLRVVGRCTCARMGEQLVLGLRAEASAAPTIAGTVQGGLLSTLRATSPWAAAIEADADDGRDRAHGQPDRRFRLEARAPGAWIESPRAWTG